MRRSAKPDSELAGTPNGGPLRALPREAINPFGGQDAGPGQTDQNSLHPQHLKSRPSPGHIN